MRKFPITSDLTGQKFNHLTAVELVSRKPTRWKCICDCGNYTTVLTTNLKSGKVKSCGCIHHRGNPKHNICYSRQYAIYKKIIRRCYNPDDPAYKNYGGRGIDVCKEWRDDVVNFYNWSIENGYSDNLSIDRIDNNKGYSPNNCRWADAKEQSNNRRSCRLYTINGIEKTLAQWCECYNMEYKTVYARLSRNWNIEEALTFRGDARIDKRRKE